MGRLCRCGRIVVDRCDCGRGTSTQRRSTSSEGHGRDHRNASERYRANHPLCERCVMLYGAIHAKPSKDMHHIASIKHAPHLRMVESNWLAVCGPCHESLEGKVLDGQSVKRWSVEGYDEALNGHTVGEPGGSKKSDLGVVDRSQSQERLSAKLEVLNG